MRGVATVLLSVLSIACGSRESSSPAVVRDSSGVTVVDYRYASQEGAGLSVSERPSLSIGMVEGERPYLFNEIAGAVFWHDGSIAVADFGSTEIRIFNRRGAFRHAIGGEGDGPGEFRFLSGLWRVGASLLAASDSRGVHMFDSNGDFIESVRLRPLPAGRTAWAVGQLDDGSIIGIHGTSDFSPNDAGRVIEDTLAFHLFSADGRHVRHLLDMEGERVWALRGVNDMRRVPFSAYPAWGTDSDGFYVASGSDAEVRRWESSGAITHLVRWRSQAVEVTDEHITRYRDYLFASTDNRHRTHYERFVNEVPLSSDAPALADARILTNEPEDIWLKKYGFPWDVSEEWFILSARGDGVTTLALPEGFRLLDVVGDKVLGVWTDEYDVEHVQVYTLQRG